MYLFFFAFSIIFLGNSKKAGTHKWIDDGPFTMVPFWRMAILFQ